MYQLQGRYEGAITLSRKVYETASRTLHPTHNVFLESKLELAIALSNNVADHQESETLLREVLRVRGSMLAPDNDDVLFCMENLARLMSAQGKYDESEKIYREALLARSLKLGPEHFKVLRIVSNLCNSLLYQQKYVECGTKIRQALESMTKILGPERMYLFRTTLLH